MENVSWLRSKYRGDDAFGRWRRHPISPYSLGALILLVLALFPLASYLLGRPYAGDSFETLPTSWALAHGRWACAYPSSMWVSAHKGISAGLAAPLFSLISAGIFFAMRIASLHPFPTTASMGPHCTHAVSLIENWMARAHLTTASLWIGIFGWLALVVAVLVHLSSNGRALTRSDALAFVAATCCTPVFWAYGFNYHPQDLLAIALVVLAVSLFSRSRWVAAGVVVGLGLLSQQFVALAAVPMLFLAWRQGRRSFVAAAALTYAAVALPLLALTSGAAWRSLLIGSSRVAWLSGARVHSAGGTWLAGLHLSSTAVFAIARLSPLVAAIVVSLVVIRRADLEKLMAIGPLTALVGLCLGLRVLFEQNLFPYYFAPLAVLLVLAANSLRLRGDLVLFWLLFATIGYSPLLDTFVRSPFIVTRTEITASTWMLIGVMAAITVGNVIAGRLRLYQPVAVVLALLMFHAPMRGLGVQASTWEMQILLGVLGVGVLASALVATSSREHTVVPAVSPDTSTVD